MRTRPGRCVLVATLLASTLSVPATPLASAQAPPPAAVETTEPQQRGLTILRRTSDTQPLVSFRDGVPTTVFATVDMGTSSMADAAEAYLDAFADLYHQVDPDLALVVDEVEPGQPAVRVRQTFQGLPVIGSGMTVLTDGTTVFGTIGEVLGARGDDTSLDIDIDPAIDAVAAEAVVTNAGGRVIGSPTLAVLHPRLVSLNRGVGTTLVWQVPSGEPAALVYIDADTGDIVTTIARDETDSAYDSFDFELFDSDGSTANDAPACYSLFNGEHIGDEDGVDHPNVGEDVNARNSIRTAYQRYHSLLGRHSYDNDGGQIELFLRTPARGFSTAPNASWSRGCDLIQTSPGFAVRDVLFHELTHGVIADTSELVYQDESGALNEHLADVMAVLLENIDDPDWRLGENLPGGALRNIETNARNRVSEYLNTLEDHGGVHSNSGIPNYAAYLAVEGGQHPDTEIQVAGVGAEAIREMLYIMTLTMSENASFDDYANGYVWLAGQLADRTAFADLLNNSHGSWFNLGTFNDSTHCAVRNSLFATEMLSVGDLDCDQVLDNSDNDDDNDYTNDNDDNCPNTPNPGQNNRDGDAQGDACDDDDDNDGDLDVDDNCQFTPNPSQADSDVDGVGDLCEDADSDGTIDTLDNCPTVWNGGQSDIDGDGLGDACDADRDGDGVPNDDDGCPNDPNPDQKDTDMGGIQDACDPTPNDPLNDYLAAIMARGVPQAAPHVPLEITNLCAGGCPDDIFDPSYRIRVVIEDLADTTMAVVTDQLGSPVEGIQASAEGRRIIEFRPQSTAPYTLNLYGLDALDAPAAGGIAGGGRRTHRVARAEGTNADAVAPDLFEVTVEAGTDLAPPEGATVVRRAGADRFRTAAAISAASFDPGGTVLVATGRNFPDALAAGPLARSLHAPILLVEADGIPNAVADELTRLAPTQVLVLGAKGVVSDEVLASLASLTDVTPVRVAGEDRYATAAAVSRSRWGPNEPVVYVATGRNYPDALAGGALAAVLDAPMLLTDPTTLSPATRTELERLSPARIVVLGGPNAVSDAVVAALDTFAADVGRLAGTTRYDTAALIAAANPFRTRTSYIATGENFPDALAATPAAALYGASILLATTTEVPQETLAALDDIAPAAVVITGGERALGPDVATTIAERIGVE